MSMESTFFISAKLHSLAQLSLKLSNARMRSAVSLSSPWLSSKTSSRWSRSGLEAFSASRRVLLSRRSCIVSEVKVKSEAHTCKPAQYVPFTRPSTRRAKVIPKYSLTDSISSKSHLESSPANFTSKILFNSMKSKSTIPMTWFMKPANCKIEVRPHWVMGTVATQYNFTNLTRMASAPKTMNVAQRRKSISRINAFMAPVVV
mmetsp:Transcript_83835/g.218272  ORF Transcript_83835/g.218272 Transcript_83835/m.218272 type:complete len:203 (-) Transcript_83835:175-783(-)